jgi:hypothetical protein
VNFDVKVDYRPASLKRAISKCRLTYVVTDEDARAKIPYPNAIFASRVTIGGQKRDSGDQVTAVCQLHL